MVTDDNLATSNSQVINYSSTEFLPSICPRKVTVLCLRHTLRNCNFFFVSFVLRSSWLWNQHLSRTNRDTEHWLTELNAILPRSIPESTRRKKSEESHARCFRLSGEREKEQGEKVHPLIKREKAFDEAVFFFFSVCL